MELISVIVPAYNAENTIERCIYSIVGGGYRNIEVIVVDDGSTDATGAIIDRIAHEDDRVVVIHQPNGGVANARNTGLDNAKGDLIAWCDADDYVEPAWLQNQWEALKQNNADFVICGCQIETMDGNVIRKPQRSEFKEFNHEATVRAFLKHNEINGILWNKLFRAELLQNIRFNSEIKYHEDDLFLWKVLDRVHTVVKTAYEDYHFVTNDSSLMGGKVRSKRIADYLHVWELIVSEASLQSMPLGQLAETTYIEGFLGCSTLIYKTGVSEENREGYLAMRKAVRELGLHKIKNLSSKKCRLQYLLLYFGIKIPKFVLK